MQRSRRHHQTGTVRRQALAGGVRQRHHRSAHRTHRRMPGPVGGVALILISSGIRVPIATNLPSESRLAARPTEPATTSASSPDGTAYRPRSCSWQRNRHPRADTGCQFMELGAGQPHTQRGEGLLKDPLHHGRRPTPMGAGQCAQHCTGITAALLRDLPAHAAGPGSSLTCDGTVPDAGTNGRGSQLSSLPPNPCPRCSEHAVFECMFDSLEVGGRRQCRPWTACHGLHRITAMSAPVPTALRARPFWPRGPSKPGCPDEDELRLRERGQIRVRQRRREARPPPRSTATEH